MSSGGPPPLVGLGNRTDLFNTPVMEGSVPAMSSFMTAPASASSSMSSMNNNHNVTSSTNNKKPAFAGTMWDNVGNVNIDLDNLSLGGRNEKKSGMPMNAMITPNASPLRAQGGMGVAPPPLRSAGSASGQGVSQSSSFDLNDLLN